MYSIGVWEGVKLILVNSTIEGDYTSRCVSVGMHSQIVLDNVHMLKCGTRIQGEDGVGGALFFSYFSSGLIISSKFTLNKAFMGAGIAATHLSNIKIINSVFNENEADLSSIAGHGATIKVFGCSFTLESTTHIGGSIIAFASGMALLKDNYFSNNVPGIFGNIIHCAPNESNPGLMYIFNNTIDKLPVNDRHVTLPGDKLPKCKVYFKPSK